MALQRMGTQECWLTGLSKHNDVGLLAPFESYERAAQLGLNDSPIGQLRPDGTVRLDAYALQHLSRDAGVA